MFVFVCVCARVCMFLCVCVRVHVKLLNEETHITLNDIAQTSIAIIMNLLMLSYDELSVFVSIEHYVCYICCCKH